MNIAIHYDPDAYEERGKVIPGIMGRRVAGKEFLDAYFTHGSWDSLTAVVSGRPRAVPLVEFCKAHQSSQFKQRRLTIRDEPEFLFDPPARLLYTPCPPDARFAWSRRGMNPAGFALCGVTHTLASPAAIQSLTDLVLAPFESFDTLICTSQAVVDMVREVTGNYAEYLKERFGGNPKLKCRLERIPLGVNPDRFHIANAEERLRERQRFQIADGECVLLCVGRLSHHAKAHPYPLFAGAEEAARRTGKKLHLLFAGWAAHPTVLEEYRRGAATFAPSVRTTFVNGQNPIVRERVWAAADLFVSLPDNIQETFGLVAIEAMASGLPVIGSDWNGYRDLIDHGETGFRIPTRMVSGSTTNLTARRLHGEVNYDHFLAECSQSVTVDIANTAGAIAKLASDEPLRKRMGHAGRMKVLEQFVWERVIHSYERLWHEQQLELAVFETTSPRKWSRYPEPEVSFRGYPTEWIGNDARLIASPNAEERLALFLEMPLTNHAGHRRCPEQRVIEELLRYADQARTVLELCEKLGHQEFARSTIAWLSKYGMLEPVSSNSPAS